MTKASVKQPKEPLVKLRVQPEAAAKNVEDWRLPNSYRNQVSQQTADDIEDVVMKPRVKKIRASQWGNYQYDTQNQNSDVDLERFPQALLIGCPESGLSRLLHLHLFKFTIFISYGNVSFQTFSFHKLLQRCTESI